MRSSAGTKLAVMAVSAVISVVTTRLIIEHFGVEAYAQYGLLASVAALLPFADLGMGAAVLNAVGGSADPRHDDHVRRTLLSALRVVVVSGVVVSAVAAAVTVAGAWPLLLGDGLVPGSGPTAALLCVLLFAVTLPAAVGQRVLTGLGRNHTRILVQGLSSPLFAALVVLLAATGTGGGQLAVLSYAVAALVAGLGALIASRLLGGVVLGLARDVPRVRAVPGAPVLGVAWPVLVQTLAVPLALQSDRLVLSHLSSSGELAQYNLAFALFSIPVQTITAAGIALWPVFARARKEGAVRSPLPMTAGFTALGLAAAVALALAVPWLAALVSDGSIALGPWLVWGFVAYVVVQAANYPPGMYMTDEAGLRFQVLPTVLMVVVSVALSLVLAPRLGAGGPIIGSAVAVGLCQVLPCLWWVRRDLRRRAALQTPAQTASQTA